MEPRPDSPGRAGGVASVLAGGKGCGSCGRSRALSALSSLLPRAGTDAAARPRSSGLAGSSGAAAVRAEAEPGALPASLPPGRGAEPPCSAQAGAPGASAEAAGGTRNKDGVGDVGGSCPHGQSEAVQTHSGQSRAGPHGRRPIVCPEALGPAPRRRQWEELSRAARFPHAPEALAEQAGRLLCRRGWP